MVEMEYTGDGMFAERRGHQLEARDCAFLDLGGGQVFPDVVGGRLVNAGGVHAEAA